MITIDEMHQMLDEVAQEFPDEFFESLNGGISLLPERKISRYDLGDDLFTLGEYHNDKMGRYIYIYYGSFMKVYGHLSRKALRQQLKKTVAHEFTHHFESLAGERGLEIKDEIQIARYTENRKAKKMRTVPKDIKRDGIFDEGTQQDSE